MWLPALRLGLNIVDIGGLRLRFKSEKSSASTCWHPGCEKQVSPDPRITTGTGQVTINGDTSVAINKDFLMDNTGAAGLELKLLRDQSLFVWKGQQGTC